MKQLLEETLRAIFTFVGQGIQFIVGLTGVVLVTGLSLSGEILDDLSTYKDSPIDWFHVAKVAGPPIALAAAAYIKHRQMVTAAELREPPKP